MHLYNGDITAEPHWKTRRKVKRGKMSQTAHNRIGEIASCMWNGTARPDSVTPLMQRCFVPPLEPFCDQSTELPRKRGSPANEVILWEGRSDVIAPHLAHISCQEISAVGCKSTPVYYVSGMCNAAVFTISMRLSMKSGSSNTLGESSSPS